MTKRTWTLVGVCVATFMLLVDIMIVNVALPSIQRDLHARLSELQWVVDAYAVALAGLTLAAGALADRAGRRLVFATGLGVFTLSSLVCGLAGSALLLEAARAFQGIGGAAMLATSLALIAQEFHGRERAAALAVWGSTVGAAVALGPLAGGILTQAFGWRWIFFVNVPIGTAALAVAVSRMSEVRHPADRRLDVPGLVTFSAALFLLTFGLVRGNAEGWTSAVILVSLVGACVFVASFVAVELARAQPMFDLSLFRAPAFCGVSLAVFALAAGMFANIFFLTLYLQNILGYAPLQAGLRLLPMTLFVFVLPLALRRLRLTTFGWLPIALGLMLVSAGLFDMHEVGASSRWTALLPGLVLAGAGIGLANPAIAAAALAVVEPARAGMASGINNTLRMVGVATGIAGLGVVFQHRITAGLGTHASLAEAVASAGTRTLPHGSPLRTVASTAFLAGLDDVLLVGCAIALAGALATIALMRNSEPAAAPAASGEVV